MMPSITKRRRSIIPILNTPECLEQQQHDDDTSSHRDTQKRTIMKPRITTIWSSSLSLGNNNILLLLLLSSCLVGMPVQGAAVMPFFGPNSAYYTHTRHQHDDPRPCLVPSLTHSNVWAMGTIPRGGAATARHHPSSGTTTKNTAASSSAWVDGLKSGLASAAAAACVKTLLQPIDAVKTMQQYTISTGGSLTVKQACTQLWSSGGLPKFYAGLGVTVVGAIPGVSLYFGVYQYCKKKLGTQTGWGQRHPLAAVALSAAIGNTVASFSRVPYEVMKQKLQTGVYQTTWEALTAAAKHPILTLFPKGGVATQMLRDVPYAVATLLVYEMLQGAFAVRDDGGLPTARERDFILGGLAGGFGSWVTTPMDVVKTRLQINSNLYGGSILTCAQHVWKEGGLPAFLRGSVPRLVHKVPANAFFFLFYETFRRLFQVEEVVQKQQAENTPNSK